VEVAAVLAQQGTAAVLVTHDRAEALTMGRRVAVMNAGRLVQIGPPGEVYGHPADAFVEGFLATTRWRA
jgi:ABC-type Fe3+/spermidine/putrescine transport system ATPase subunit